MHVFLMFVDTSIAYKKKHPLYLFVKSYILNVRYQMLFLTFYLFFFDVSYINCFMLLIFFQFILCTDQSFSGILSVVITILGRRYSHFLLEYFTESKGITIAAGNCNLLHRQICKCELLLSSGNSKFRQKIFRRDSKTVHKYCI